VVWERRRKEGRKKERTEGRKSVIRKWGGEGIMEKEEEEGVGGWGGGWENFFVYI
jgi:hypothetical protein